MSLKNISFGSFVASSDLNNNFSESLVQAGLNTIRQLINRAGVWSLGTIDGWGEAYIDADGRENSVSAASATFNSNRYEAEEDTTMPFVIIEATSISATSDFEINDCHIIKVASGKWQLSCDTGTAAVRRAQIYKTLFYGSNGSDPRAEAT